VTDKVRDERGRLDAVDELLRLVVEVLDPEREPREAARTQRVEMRARRDARIRLDRSVHVGRRRQPREEPVDELGELVRREKRRRAAPEMDLAHAPPGQRRHARQVRVELAQHEMHIRLRPAVIPGNHRVAAAERAERLAERQMHVERERRVGRGDRGVERRDPLVGRRLRVPLGHRRITRVPRHRHVVARE